MHIDPAPDLVALTPAHRQLIDSLSRAGGRPFAVGGCVRDSLAGRPFEDLDLEVHGRPIDELEAALRADGFDVDDIGCHFGVVTVAVDGGSVDVSVPRRDEKTGSGHRDFRVVPDASLSVEQAASRRDFTINALLWDTIEHRLVDPFGGVADLRAGVLRHVSPAFGEDPLRVLRAAQLAARFDLTMDAETIEICRAVVDDFEHLPSERIGEEWMKIVRPGARPSRALDVLRSTEWLRHHPELLAIEQVPQDPRWHPEGTVEVHVGQVADLASRIADRDGLDHADRMVLVFAALCHDLGKSTHTQVHADGRVTAHGHAEAGVAPSDSFLRSIGVPRSVVDSVLPLVAEHMCAATVAEPTPNIVRRLARRLGPTSIEMWARVVEADHGGRGAASVASPVSEWVAIAREIAVERRPVRPIVSGDLLIRLGLRPGPGFRAILDAAMAAQDAGEITDEASAEAWTRAHVSAGAP